MPPPAPITFPGTFVTSLPSPPSGAFNFPAKKPPVKIKSVVTDLNSVLADPSTALPTAPNMPSAPQLVSVDGTAPTFSSTFTPAAITIPSGVTPSYGAADSAVAIPTTTVSSAPQTLPSLSFVADDSASLSTLTAPTIAIAERTGLTAVDLLTYEAQAILPFDPVALPEYTKYTPTAVAAPGELTYEDDADFIKTVKDQSDSLSSIRTIYEGDTAYLPVDELYATQKVFAQAAARGFSMPTGAINAAMAELGEKSDRDHRQAFEKARDEVRDSTRQVQAAKVKLLTDLETRHAALLYSYAAKTIEVSRFNTQMAVEVLQAAVEAYNTYVRVVNTFVGAYRAYTKAVAEQDEAVVAQVRSARARLRTNSADIDMYSAQLDLQNVATQVGQLSVDAQALVFEEFEQKVRLYQQNVQIAKLSLEAYRESINTISQQTETDLTRVRAYAQNVETEATKLAVYNANLDAYAASVRADGDRSQAYSQYVNAGVAAFSQHVNEYREYVSTVRAHIQENAAGVRAALEQAQAFSRLSTLVASSQNAIAEADIELSASKASRDLAREDYNSRLEGLTAQSFVEQTRIDAGLESAKLSTYSGLAQAAYSTFNVSARITDDGQWAEDSSISARSDYSKSGRRAWTKTTTFEESAA